MKKQRSTMNPTAAMTSKLSSGGLNESSLTQQLRGQLAQDPALLHSMATQSPTSATPYLDALREQYGEEADDVTFHGGTPEARWALAGLGVSAFAHDGHIVTANANPDLEVMGHEMAHLVQGAGGSPSSVGGSSSAESEAGAAGRAVASGESAEVTGSATPNALHGFPGLIPIPFESPVHLPRIDDLLEEVVEAVVERVVQEVVHEVVTAVEDVRDAVVDTVSGWGDAIKDTADSVADGVGDALNLRENEDLLDIEEEVALGELSADADAIEMLFMILRAKRAGLEVPAEDLTEVRAHLQGLDNQTFRALIQALDEAGLLQEVSQHALDGGSEEENEDIFEVPVFNWRFWNADDDIDADLARANEIYEPHKIHVQQTSQRVISKTEVETIVGHEVPNEFGLDRTYDSEESGKTYTHEDMVATVDALGVGSAVSGLWVPTVVNQRGAELAGTSMHTESFTHGANIAFVATDDSGADTFAHELGHILTREGHFSGDSDNLMTRGRDRDKDNVEDDRLTDEQVENIRGDVLGYIG